MNISNIIKRQIDKTGSNAVLSDGNWTSMPFKCFLESLWRRKSSMFDDDVSMIGVCEGRYYLYIGPLTHDITSLSDEANLIVDGKKFSFMRRNGVKINNEVIYFTGIAREVKEAKYDEY